MNNNKISPISFIITAVGVILIIVAIVIAKRHPVPVTPAATTPATTTADDSQSSSVCYVLNKPTTSGGKDIAYLKVTSTDGTAVTGELGTALDGKDKINGTLVGTASENAATKTVLIDAQYSNTGEGMNNVTQQMIKLSETEAQIGYGDMKADTDGTYSYADPSKVTYSLSLPSVDCGQYDSLKTTALSN